MNNENHLQTITRTTPGPWSRGQHTLDPNNLTAYEKRWLGYQLAYDKCMPSDLSRRFGLKTDLLRKYKSKILKEEPFYAKNGKPRCVDEIGEKNLAKKV